jgi:methylenetetrahydrofolate--tRNA-(uracil-5-)-methyltransferase
MHFISSLPGGADGCVRGGFQPMPPNFGLLPELRERIRDKRRRYGAYRDRALADLEAFMATSGLGSATTAIRQPVPA